MKRLTVYILARFLGNYALFLMLIMLLAVVFDISQKIDDFLSSGAPLSLIIGDYYIHFIAFYGTTFSALIVFLSTVFFTSRLAAQTELVPMMSGGFSYNRLLRTYTLGAFLVFLFVLVLSHFVIPMSNVRLLAFESAYISDVQPRDERPVHIHRQIKPGQYIYLETWSPERQAGYHFTYERMENGVLVQKLSADFIRFDTLKNRWFLDNYVVRNFKKQGELVIIGRSMDTVFDFGPQRVLPQKSSIATMHSLDLWKFLQEEKVSGVESLKNHWMEFHRRTAYPAGTFVLVIIALALASPKRRGGIGTNIAIGLVLAVVYIFFVQIAGILTATFYFPPWLSVWTPNLVFGMLAVYMTWKAQK